MLGQLANPGQSCGFFVVEKSDPAGRRWGFWPLVRIATRLRRPVAAADDLLGPIITVCFVQGLHGPGCGKAAAPAGASRGRN
jgi:hypothetical protein